jgi:pSer/pThr/pTyr-binding forkhead associated (FHA) protein
MPRLILRFDDRDLAERSVGQQAVTIGRLPDCDLVVDNAAVSGRHAKVYKQGDKYVIEDLQSTNGTFVNGQRAGSQALKDGDKITIGKHTIVFDLAGGEAKADPALKTEFLPELGGTMRLDTERHRSLMSSVAEAKSKGTHSAANRVGTLTVVDGQSDQSRYTLSSHTSMIGKADTCLIRLKGWFKPKTALAIARKGDGYSATPLGGKTLINGEKLTGRRDLEDGDVLQVSGLTLEFHFKDQ